MRVRLELGSGRRRANVRRSTEEVKIDLLRGPQNNLFASVTITLSAGLVAGRNRCQFYLAGPITAVVGALYGYDVATAYDIQPVVGILAGILGLTLFVYLQLVLEPQIVHWVTDESGRFHEAVAFAWDAVTGTVVGLPLFWYLDVAPIPAMVAAAGVGTAYGYFAGWVICGSAAELALGSIVGGLGGARRRPDHSQIQALEARGEYESARTEYEKVLRDDPQHVGAAIRLGRMLAESFGRPEDGIAVIRPSLAGDGAPYELWAFVLRVMGEICAARLGDPSLILPDLRRLVARHPNGPDGTWAAQRIQWIESDDQN